MQVGCVTVTNVPSLHAPLQEDISPNTTSNTVHWAENLLSAGDAKIPSPPPKVQTPRMSRQTVIQADHNIEFIGHE